MSKIEDEQKRIVNSEYEKNILYLIGKIKKYRGRYSTKELEEWLMALLMLEIDIQKDNTYDEETLKGINKIDFVQEIINYNIYGNIRYFLEKYDKTLMFPGRGYNGTEYSYPVWHDRFVPGEKNIPRSDSDKIQIIEISTTGDKSTITLTGPTKRSKEIRQLQIDEMILKLYKKSLEKPKTNFNPLIDNHYRMQLSPDIQILYDWICRCNEDPFVQPHGLNKTQIGTSIDEESKRINDYVYKLYEELQNEYGKIVEPIRSHKIPTGKIDIDTKGTITETYKVKETPIVTWQKKITHY